MRGKVVQLLLGLTDKGITPACAGKSNMKITLSFNQRDHPRVCGEKQTRLFQILQSQGSPPRVRGKDILEFIPDGDIRITPACAGKRHDERPGQSRL